MSKSSKRKRASTSRADVSPSSTTPPQTSSERAAHGTDSSGLSRWEIGIVVVVLACGVALRIAFPERLAVEHFDEGVYASNLWFEVGEQYPARHLYAPSLVPALIEGSLLAEQVFSGHAARPTGFAAMFPSLLAGCLTPLIVWWVMWKWFGPAAAIGAATLAAFSEFHALYSRTALTDVLLLPWMLLAVFLFERALATRSLRLLVLAGLACGLAWWTKYNGWLPLLIALGGVFLRLVFVKAAWRSVGLDLGYWVGFAGVAAVVWSPYLWSLQAYGGYAPVQANHRCYVVGLTGWPTSFTNQLANLAHFDGWLSCLVPSAALLALIFMRRVRLAATPCPQQGARLDVLLVFVFAATSIALAAWFGLAVVLSYLSVSGLLAFGLRQRKSADDGAASGGLALWLVAAWFTGLLVATPLYSAYPRLTLTWLCASWLGGGLGVAVLGLGCVGGVNAGRIQSFVQGGGGRFAMVVVLLVSLTGTFYASQRVTARGVPAWQDRAGLRSVATSIKTQIDSEASIVFVQGEPGLFYQLRAAGIVAVPGFDFNRSPASLPAGVGGYLATGLHAQRSDEFQRQLAAGKSRLQEVATLPYQPSDLVLLNNFRPHQLDEQRRATWRVRLYRIK